MTRGNHQPSPETGHTRVRGRISQRAVLLGPTNSGRSERRLRTCPPRFETSTGGYRNPGFRPTLCLPGCLPLGPSNLSEPRFPQSRGIAAAQMRLEAVDAPRELQSPASGPVSGMAQVSGSSKVPLWSCRRHRREMSARTCAGEGLPGSGAGAVHLFREHATYGDLGPCERGLRLTTPSLFSKASGSDPANHTGVCKAT